MSDNTEKRLKDRIRKAETMVIPMDTDAPRLGPEDAARIAESLTPRDCARHRSVSPHQCYSHEDVTDAENRAGEHVRTSALALVHAAIKAMGVLSALDSYIARETLKELHAGIKELGMDL